MSIAWLLLGLRLLMLAALYAFLHTLWQARPRAELPHSPATFNDSQEIP